MPEKLKHTQFTPLFMDNLSQRLHTADSRIDPTHFKQAVYTPEWESKELKAKMRHVSHALHAVLPNDYPEAIVILKKVAPHFSGFEGVLFSEYVECYGLNDWETSLAALPHFTKYGSAEFAIRPFLQADLKRGMAYMQRWATDENEHVRRLASEGCRPRLPWARSLTALKKDPRPIFPILETLKDDPSLYVRRSVANNLNDISKDHPEQMLDLVQRWQGHAPTTDWIIKHACRTLLKKGHIRTMRLFDFQDPHSIQIKHLTLQPNPIHIGQALYISFELHIEGKEDQRLRIAYAIDYVKKSGKLSQKVFHLREGYFSPAVQMIEKKQSFADMSTRKHYAGGHRLAIIVNGIEKARAEFELLSALS